MTAVLAIGSGGSYVDLPTPSYGGYMTTPNEVSKAGTNTSGVLYKDRIRIRQSIEVHWNTATAEEKNLILWILCEDLLHNPQIDLGLSRSGHAEKQERGKALA